MPEPATRITSQVGLYRDAARYRALHRTRIAQASTIHRFENPHDRGYNKPEKLKRSKFRLIISIILLIAGMGISMYPHTAKYINSLSASKLAETHSISFVERDDGASVMVGNGDNYRN